MPCVLRPFLHCNLATCALITSSYALHISLLCLAAISFGNICVCTLFSAHSMHLYTQCKAPWLLSEGHIVCVFIELAECSMFGIQKKTQFHQKKECCAGALEGSFLKSLVGLTGAKTVLEVGMFTGTSSLSMAEALPSDGKVAVGQIHTFCVSCKADFCVARGKCCCELC